MSRLAAAILFSLLCSCGTYLPAVPHAEGDVAIRIVEDGMYTERVLRVDSVEAQRLAKWLDDNAGGWHVYYATAPRDGIFVSTRLGGLQFTRSGVIALRREGQYAKQVSDDMYVLLRGAGREFLIAPDSVR